MLVLAILFWFRKYKWKQTPESQRKSPKETLAIMDIKRQNPLFDIETASPFSDVDKPSSEDGDTFPSRIKSPPQLGQSNIEMAKRRDAANSEFIHEKSRVIRTRTDK